MKIMVETESHNSHPKKSKLFSNFYYEKNGSNDVGYFFISSSLYSSAYNINITQKNIVQQ